MYSYAVNNPLSYVDPDGRHAIAVGFPEGARGLGHAGIISVHEDGTARFADYGPRTAGSFHDKGHVRSFALNKVQFGADGMPTKESYQAMAKEISAQTGYSPDLMKFAFFSGSDAEAIALDNWIKSTQDASDRGTIQDYWGLGASCRDYCITGMSIGRGTGDPGYFYRSRVPNAMTSAFMRTAQSTYDAQTQSRGPKAKKPKDKDYEVDINIKWIE